MKNKVSGEVTVEAAIVIPIVILIVVSLVYFAFGIHDIVMLKSYAYSTGMEYSELKLKEFSEKAKMKISKAPTLVVTPIVECYKQNDEYYIEIKGTKTGDIKFLDNFISDIKIEQKIESNINRDQMYMVRGVIDFIGE